MMVYKYGCLRPCPEHDALIREQLRLACRYRNALVELHRWRRAAEWVGGVPREATRLLWNEMSRYLRANSGLGYGTYQAIEDDVSRSISKERARIVLRDDGSYRYEGRFRSAPIVRFRRFDGSGRIGANVQSASELSTDKVATGAGLFSLAAPIGKTIARLLVGPKGNTVHIELPIKLHRPLPDTTKIVRVLVCIERVGDRYVYTLSVTLKASKPKLVTGRGLASINFGWRRVKGGVRVAYAVTDHGEHSFVLPQRLIDRLIHSESLRSIADKSASEYLGDSRKRTRSRREGLSSGENKELSKLHGPFQSLEHWARRDRHLYQWECDERHAALLARREIYRQWARLIAHMSDRVCIEDFSLHALASRDGDAEIPAARHYRFLVAPSVLRQEVASVFGDALEKLPKRKRTTVCHACGGECAFDRARKLEHVCEHCGDRWDQDENNARNQAAHPADRLPLAS